MQALLDGLHDPHWHWGVGVFGAIGEFTRMPDEPADITRGHVVTARGAIRVAPPAEALLLAHEQTSRRAHHWQQGLTLCLPTGHAALPGAADTVTELGPDTDALRPQDRGAILFDMGLGFSHLRACVRSAEPAVIAAIRAGCGRPLLEPGNPAGAAIPALSPHRVFITRAARVEVFQPIPPPDGRSPEGPHTHLLPQLLRARRTHAATLHIPDGWVPVLDAFPPHPQADAMGEPVPFDTARHAAFQALLAAHGSATALAEKSAVRAALATGAPPDALPEPSSREARATRRVTLRQAARDTPGLAAWRARWDRAEAEELDPAPPGHG
ncbi:MAG: hypothetical protein NTW56_06005 [Alphaproteobacteria bacterium]|nr:hypothetical protein [Alphaproteobacteria bacterium]